MRKNASFLFLSLFLLGFFACDLAIPKAIEIIGTPSTKFAETVDVGKMFTDLLEDAINEKEGLTMIPCPETEIITSLIHAELLNKEFDDLEDGANFYDIFPHSQDDNLADDIDNAYPLDSDKTLYKFDSEKEDPENCLIVPLSELGLLLPGFEFYNGKDKDGNPEDDQDGVYKSKLYISGSEIIKKTKIVMTIGKFNDEGKYDEIDSFSIENNIIINKIGKSDINKWEEKGYDKDSCPDGGIEIDIPITGENIAISFTILIPKGQKLKKDDFKACKINIEVVVWLPFKFIAVKDDAALHFPDDSFFSSEDDLFGREEPDSESLIASIIEWLSVDVRFKNNPFDGAKLIIGNRKDKDTDGEKGVNIPTTTIKGDTLSFKLNEDNMKEINDPENWPFIPDIKIGFAEEEKLIFPKIFNAIEFAFKARVRYRKDFE
jgi:hypothetical protein